MTEIVRAGVNAEYNRFVRIITWTGLLGTDSGQMIDLPRFSDKTVHVFGTFGGATVTLYGSNDPKALVDRTNGTLFGSKTASWVALTDTLGNNLAISASDALKTILEDPLYILPVVTGGSGSSLSVIIACKKEYA